MDEEKIYRDRARYNSISDLVDRYSGQYVVLYESWKQHFAGTGMTSKKVRDKAKHAAQSDLVDNHRPEFVRLRCSWLTHYARQAGIDFTPSMPARDPSGKFLPR